MFIKVGHKLGVPMGRGWVFMENIQKIVEDLSAMRQDMIDASGRIYIVNAGRMNHGKSSLLNSILGREAFRVADVRETRVNQEELYKDDVFLVDTPGLDADETDDREAFSVYKILLSSSIIPRSGKFIAQNFRISDVWQRRWGRTISGGTLLLS